jgi:pimeloyl-ACP methyl ester carboxylesterase
MATIRELGTLAAAVYGPKRTWVQGWKCTDFHAASGALNGFQAATFVRGGVTVVCYRGSAQLMDGVADLKLGTGMNSTYFSEGEAYARPHKNKPGVYVCGHSLGGAIAQVVANRGGFRMVTFNAPGVAVLASRNLPDATLTMTAIRAAGFVVGALRHPMQTGRDIAAAFNVVRGLNVCLQYDVVSRVGVHYGEVLRIPGTSMNPYTEHLIATVNLALDRDPVGKKNVQTL